MFVDREEHHKAILADGTVRGQSLESVQGTVPSISLCIKRIIFLNNTTNPGMVVCRKYHRNKRNIPSECPQLSQYQESFAYK